MTVIQWNAKQGTVKVGTIVTTVSTTATLASQVSTTDYSAEVTDVRVTGTGPDVSVLNVFGSQLVEEARPDLVTIEFTKLFQDEVFNSWMYNATATQFSSGTTYSRFQGAEPFGNRVTKAVLLTMTDGTNTVSIMLNNAYETQSDISWAADGKAEQTVQFKGLLTNLYIEGTP